MISDDAAALEKFRERTDLKNGDCYDKNHLEYLISHVNFCI